jgi:hypothetical protein
MTMYQPGDRVWLRTAGGEMLARLIDPDARSDVVIWLIEVEGGPRMLAREDQFRPADDADLSLVVEG